MILCTHGDLDPCYTCQRDQYDRNVMRIMASWDDAPPEQPDDH